jgi:hypothetical protein
MGLVAVREGALYHVVDFDMIVRAECVDTDEEEVHVAQVDGDYENTLDMRTFEDRMADDKVVLKEPDDNGGESS